MTMMKVMNPVIMHRGSSSLAFPIHTMTQTYYSHVNLSPALENPAIVGRFVFPDSVTEGQVYLEAKR